MHFHTLFQNNEKKCSIPIYQQDKAPKQEIENMVRKKDWEVL